MLRVVEQLAGYAVPATAWESLVLPARVAGYQPAWLDELTTAGEVVWTGQGALPGTDGWISLHVADTAQLTVPDPLDTPESPVHAALLAALDGGGAYFFRALADGVRSHGDDLATVTDSEIVTALWDLAWGGLVTNDTLAPLRALVSGRGRAARTGGRPRSRYSRARAAGMRAAPPTAAGRWSLVPEASTDTTRRAHAAAEALLQRHGIVTRGAVVSERVPGGFAAAYRVLGAFEESGRARRGYFVAGLGAAQFATPGAVDRLRTVADPVADASGGHTRPADRRADGPRALVLAATDPGNPYGAALPWPERDGSAHRPGRKAGALVVLVDGDLALYVERGGRTLLSWTDDPTTLQAVADALALAVREGALGALRIERADGDDIVTTPLGTALAEAGFHITPRGLRLRR